MGCQKGKSTAKSKAGCYHCKKCGAVAKKEKHLCKPRSVKKSRSK